MFTTYKKIKELFNEVLNDNDDGILFQTSLFNSENIAYQIEEYNSDGVNVDTKKIVPAHIVEISGNYINIPNTDVVEASIGLDFDIFVKDYTKLPYKDQARFLSANYLGTMNAINNFQSSLLAQVKQLGTTGIMFGGTDSTANFVFSDTIDFKYNTIYMKLDIKTTDTEEIFYTSIDTDNYILIQKDATNIGLYVKIGGTTYTVLVPYSIGVNDIYAYYDATNYWNLVVNSETDNVLCNVVQNEHFNGTLSRTKNFNGVLYQLLIDDDVITPTDIEDGLETVIVSPKINLKDFTSRYSFNQEGSYSLVTNTVTDCILWGSEGNIVFGFETLVPIDEVRYADEGYPRQLFTLGINCLISKDVIFGNNTEYFLDDEQVYPLDRSHTYGTELGTATYIDDTTAKSIVEENAQDITQTFFAKPNKKLIELQKQVTKLNSVQNTVYELKVQYPFYSETYNVIIDSGGTTPNLNSLQTITVTYKNKDDSLT
jgi:hypothetical protein